MEILELLGVPYFKKGKGIHIKKKNRGKFTDYCGGKVTDECIKRAKKSKNPTLRKRATFADNARKWKHQEGGILKVQEGATTSSERTPTLEEYIQMKLQEARQRALANSYNATEPRLAKRYYDEKDLRDLRFDLMEAENKSKKYTKLAEEIEKALNHPFAPKHVFMFNPIYKDVSSNAGLSYLGEEMLNELNSKRIGATSYKSDIKEYQDRLEYINEHGYDWTGFNCITNATGWYGDPYVCASNVDFKENPSKYGFVEINVDDALPGDIFQYEEGNEPYHATMYSKKGDNGEYYSNYSNGNYKNPIAHDSKYWGKGQNAFRFVGLPEDIEAWTQEYNKLYGKKFGGVLGEFKEGGPIKTFNINNSVSPTQYWDEFIAENSVPFTVVPEAPIDEKELAKRQAWAESAGNDRARSPKGAKGRYQIIPSTLREYQAKTKDYGSIYDPKYNRRVRDWEFNRYNNSETVNMGNPTDSVKMGRRLAVYNYGLTNVNKTLTRLNKEGINTTTNFDWLNHFPKETRDYVNFILRGKDTGAHRTNEAYRNRNK